LTARCTVHTIPVLTAPTGGELLWLERPNDTEEALKGSWKEHILTEGPDVEFTIIDFDEGDDTFEVVAQEFFMQRLVIYSITKPTHTGGVSLPRVANTFVIDEGNYTDGGIGHAYHMDWIDINGDGKREILVNNHEGPPGPQSGGAIFAYEYVGYYRDGKSAWKRRTLVKDAFEVTQPGNNQMSPGFLLPYHPEGDARPSFFVAGDGSQRAYLFTPADSDDGWGYEMTWSRYVGDIVGQVAVHDIDGDGVAEVFVPSYGKNFVEVWTFLK